MLVYASFNHLPILTIMEFIITQKGGQRLLWHFVVNRKMGNGRIYWRCSKCTCPARVTTQEEELLQQTNGHNHAMDETDSHVEQIRSNLRKEPEKRSYRSHQSTMTRWLRHWNPLSTSSSSCFRSCCLECNQGWCSRYSRSRWFHLIHWINLVGWQIPSTYLELLLPWRATHQQSFGRVA